MNIFVSIYFIIFLLVSDAMFSLFLIQLCVFFFQRKTGYSTNGKRRVNHKVDMEKREEMIRRTVYVSDIDQQVKV